MIATLNTTSSRLSARTRGLLALAALAVLAAPLVYLSRTPAAQAEEPEAAPGAVKEPAAEFLPPLTKAEEKILAALEQPTIMDFPETPLEDAVAYLKDYHHIEIQFDVKALEEAGIGQDTPVTRKLNGISLRAALRLLLSELDLTFDVRDEVLQITTKEQSSHWLITRTYPVGDIIEGNDDASLIEALTGTIDSQTWDEYGGPGSIASVVTSKSLVISQTRDVHDKVLQLLRSLRAARKASTETSK